MTLKIRELIIRAEISDPELRTGEKADSEPAYYELKHSVGMTDRFYDDERTQENER